MRGPGNDCGQAGSHATTTHTYDTLSTRRWNTMTEQKWPQLTQKPSRNKYKQAHKRYVEREKTKTTDTSGDTTKEGAETRYNNDVTNGTTRKNGHHTRKQMLHNNKTIGLGMIQQQNHT